MYVDSHCHLDFPGLAERETEILQAMEAARVTHALCVSVTLEDFPRVAAYAARHPNLYASVGVHPDYTGVTEPDLAMLVELARTPRVIAIGETGLDYYRGSDTAAMQRERFRTHIRAARATRLPLIIHTRAAAEDTLAIMREEGADAARGVMHCFTESVEVARAALELGFYISLSGIVSFRNAEAIRDVARFVPLERLLIETDAPYLAPVPHRGKTNQPAFVAHVAEHVARARGDSVEQIARATTRNFFDLFSAAEAPADLEQAA
ncbi:MAG: TatD family hydrolase [Rhodocyclaceae bacterium]|nr:TatD family hydrolase [Rhodocyclaceae bacterium]MBX3670003.1 TatD family hydrolase [Rhodocyclaceae bacterium]